MTEKELFEKYPEAFKIIKEWYINKMVESTKDTPQEFIEAMKDRIDGMIFSVADKNPSLLIELFDMNDIYIFINLSGENKFIYRIFTGTTKDNTSPLMLVDGDGFPIRKCAEKAAIIEAVRLLDEKHQKG